jgi:hypothetical protein
MKTLLVPFQQLDNPDDMTVGAAAMGLMGDAVSYTELCCIVTEPEPHHFGGAGA